MTIFIQLFSLTRFYYYFFKQALKSIYIDADLKYAYDGVGRKNSATSTILFSYDKNGPFGGTNINNWSKYEMNSVREQQLLLSFYSGIQSQGVFNAKDKDAKGFIMRPMFVPGVQYQIMSIADKEKPIIRFMVDYTGRFDAINTTEYRERYTDLFKAGIDYFLAYKPVKFSVGGSFNYGSDPIKGLEKQQFWLLSINISN